jgi:hypothetical protein
MVLRIVGIASVVVCVLLTLNVAVAQAAYRGPVPGGMPGSVPTCGPSVVPVGPGFVTTGPAMAMPRPMSCMPACPPPCPPSCGPAMCEPPCETGFSPLSAVWGMVSLPFKLIGGIFGGKRDCGAVPMCPPSCCMPMLPPPCGPVCAPITKVKPARMPRAAYHRAPMPIMQ